MMDKKKWFLFFFLRSISQRKGRIAIASISATLAVSLVSGMAAITSGIKEKLGSELKAYGANIIISPRGEDYLDYAILDKIKGIQDIDGAEGQVISTAYMKDRQIEIIGLDLKKIIDSGWRLYGSIPEKNGYVLAGTNLKNAFNLNVGDPITLSSENKKIDFIVSGFFEKGGAEDNAILMSISDAWELIDRGGFLSIILARGRTGKVDETVKYIERVFPDVVVKTIRQVALAEESLLSKIQLLMVLITCVVVLAASISIGSTMGANVLERRQEIGLMKAIGATRRDIGIFYITESLLIGIIGGLAGFVLGIIAAQAISKGAFDSFVSISLYIPVISVFTGLAVSLVSSYIPVKNAIKYNPAFILRGE